MLEATAVSQDVCIDQVLGILRRRMPLPFHAAENLNIDIAPLKLYNHKLVDVAVVGKICRLLVITLA